jgi:hypothetical protein
LNESKENFFVTYSRPKTIKKIKIVKPVERTKDGTLVLDFNASETSSDWLYYGHLKEKADVVMRKPRKKFSVKTILRR